MKAVCFIREGYALASLVHILFQWLPRLANSLVDVLAKQGVSGDILNFWPLPPFCCIVLALLVALGYIGPWHYVSLHPFSLFSSNKTLCFELKKKKQKKKKNL